MVSPLAFALLLLQTAGPPRQRLIDMSFEELMNVRVTSVSKKEQRLAQTAAAIYVITREQIRHSAATTLPELLRSVPGVQVARIDANKWAVSVRGFNGRFSNKLLVLIDGRSVYTPTFSGVYWELQDTLLEDIERIEVIRGPGATLWGANAVNGVINIITRHTRETQGGLVVAGGGNEEQGFAALRYGGRLGGGGHYRVYSKYFNRDHLFLPGGGDAPDRWHAVRGGFRVDWQLSTTDSLLVEGDLDRGGAGQRVPVILLPPSEAAGSYDDHVGLNAASLLARWERRSASGSEAALQVYYDRYSRQDAVLAEQRQTVDLTLEHRLRPIGRHDIQWGVGARYTRDNAPGGRRSWFEPPSWGDKLFSAYLRDELALAENRLRLTLGSKLEHNGYTGFEVQPGVQLLWSPTARHAAWASVSRAMRTPSRFGRAYFSGVPLPGGLVGTTMAVLDSDFQSEELRAHELGYRMQPTRWLSLDLASFYNLYDHLVTMEPGTPRPAGVPGQLLIPLIRDNDMYGAAYGLEAAAHATVHRAWKLSANYSRLRPRMHVHSAATDVRSGTRFDSPAHQGTLESNLDLPRRLSLDTALYLSTALPEAPGYARLDARAGWQPKRELELSVGAINLTGKNRIEFVPEALTLPSAVRRSVYVKLTWQL